MLMERRLHVLRHSFVPEAREHDDTFLTQIEQDFRRADILWLLYPERGTGEALSALGLARALKGQAAHCPRIVVSHASSASQATWAPALTDVQMDYRAASDELGFHDICNAAQRVIMRRTLRPPAP